MRLNVMLAAVAVAVGCSPSEPDLDDLDQVDRLEVDVGERRLAVAFHPSPEIVFPGPVDSNSPAWWDDDWGLVVMNSEHQARGAAGPSVDRLGPAELSGWSNTINGGRWIEAVWPTDDGVVYGWYHNEPFHLCCTFGPDGAEISHSNLTAPQIGAARSFDAGGTWEDLGVVMTAPSGSLDCSSTNGYFGGGTGDFSVMLDPEGQWLYFFFTSFAGPVQEQGIAVAAMAWSDRNAPVGKVVKHRNGSWTEPGLGGRASPMFPATVAVRELGFDSLWGPSIHWNTHLERYVILMSRAQGPAWEQEGIYASLATKQDLDDPDRWSAPQKILDGGGWYPQVIGVGETEYGTDRLAGRRSRFFVQGRSVSEIELSWAEP